MGKTTKLWSSPKVQTSPSVSLSLLVSSLLLMASGWAETATPPAQPLLWQHYLGLPRPEAEGHPGQQYNSSTARVPEGLRPERRDLGGL